MIFSAAEFSFWTEGVEWVVIYTPKHQETPPIYSLDFRASVYKNDERLATYSVKKSEASRTGALRLIDNARNHHEVKQ